MWETWVGRQGPAVQGPYPVSVAAIGYVAEAVQDAGLISAIAREELTRAPATFINVASRIPSWQPSADTEPMLQALSVPLPANVAVNRRVEQHYFKPLAPGDRITSQSTIKEIVPKRTRVGSGFFVTEEITRLEPECQARGPHD